MLVSEPAVNRVIDDVRLKAGDFYLDRHRAIYGVMVDLYAADKPCDHLTVNEALAEKGLLEEVGGKNAVFELSAKVSAPGNVRHHAEIVKEHALLRRLLETSHQIGAWVNEREAPADELSERAEALLFNVAHKEQAGDFRQLNEVLDDEVDRLHKLASGELTSSGVKTGFTKLDDLTGGLQPSNLIIVAARPSVGKSAFVANLAENVAVRENRSVAFFSLEMSEIELAQRFIASQAGIPGDRLRKGKISTSDRSRDWSKVIDACNKLDQAPLFIDVTSDLGLLDLRAKARRLHAQEQKRNGVGLSLIVVDYLQLMRMDESRASMVEKVGQISRGLKLLANELELPVVALSQLSRANESRPDKRPVLSDLRDSGNIEQDADLVAFLYREDVYRRDPNERDGSAEVIVSKHRNGPVGMVPLAFMATIPKFVEPAPAHPAGEGSPAAVRAESETAA
ncbi:MAG: replicative DNA helicase [Solirubrobacterales bacterium]|nr:replicative DNA helicase [Solirubrobacterales bacterium]